MLKTKSGTTVASIIKSILPFALLLTASAVSAQGPATLYLGGTYNHNPEIKAPAADTPQFTTVDNTTYTLEIAITGGVNPYYEVTSLYLLDDDGNKYGPSQTISETDYVFTKGFGGSVTVAIGHTYRFTVTFSTADTATFTIGDLGIIGTGGDDTGDGTHKSIKLDYTYNHLPKRKLTITPDTEITFDGNNMYITNSTGRYMNSLDNLGGFSISSDRGTQLSEITTGIVTPVSNSLQVLHTGTGIEITGAQAGTEIYLYNISGFTVAYATQYPDSDTTFLHTGTITPGIYILTVGKKSFKLAIR